MEQRERIEQMKNEQLQKGFIGELIQDGFYDKLVIIGFPYDEGAKQGGARGGADYGPDSFRRFVKDIGAIRNPEYQVDISLGLPKISDYGNIQIVSEPPAPKASLQELHQKLTTKVGLCVKRGNLVFAVGGSRDLFGAVSEGILIQEDSAQVQNVFISINHSLDLDPLVDQGVPHSLSSKRYFLERINGTKDYLIEFGTNGQLCRPGQLDYFQQKNPNGKIFWQRDIRKHQIDQSGIASTQAGNLFLRILNQIQSSQGQKRIYISLNLESFSSAVGVSTNCLSGGFTSEEAVEICYLSGFYGQSVVAMDISEYNPFVEDWKSGRMVATMFYYFALGMSQRLQSVMQQ